jgi:hypothetical protein
MADYSVKKYSLKISKKKYFLLIMSPSDTKLPGNCIFPGQRQKANN